MSKIFKRPMFRRGGNVMEGIMTGIQDRKNYANGPENPEELFDSNNAFNSNIADNAMLASDYFMDRYGKGVGSDVVAQALISGGLRAIGGAGAGKGKAAELATAFSPVVDRAFEQMQRQRDTKMGLAIELYKGMSKDDRLAFEKKAEQYAKLKGIPIEEAKLKFLEQDLSEASPYLKGASPENRIRAREEAYLKNQPYYIIGMNSDEIQNVAIFEQTNFDKKLAGQKTSEAIMGVYPLVTDLKVENDVIQFVPTNQNKDIYNELVSGGRYFIPSLRQIAVFDKNTNIFTPIE